MNRPFLLAVAAAVAVFALGAAPALAADTPPAYNVYVEQVPTASGGKPVGTTKQSGQTGQYGQPVPLSTTAATNLQHQGGKDKNLLKQVATSPAYHAAGRLTAAGAPTERAPSALGATFGLGSGPTALFVMLIVGAILGFAAGRFRGRRS